jgi:glycine/D-amino acid oxidase-like deaminating enzyme
MSLASYLPTSFKHAERADNAVVVAGGGMAAMFTAYEILKQAKDAGQKINVIVLAEQFSAPSVAGSHVVLELEGLFNDRVKNRGAIHNLLRDGLQNFEATIEREQIQSRYNKGYEIKAQTKDSLFRLIDTLTRKKIYDEHEITINSHNQLFRLPAHDHSISVNSIGQINVPELLRGLAERITRMGGQIKLGVKYMGQASLASGDHMIYTSEGALISPYKPFLATGASHQNLLPSFNAAAKMVYTMGLVMGPLHPSDAAAVSRGPMAFCDDEMDGDVLWGGLDAQNYFTFGYGDIESVASRDQLLRDIRDDLDKYYPGLTAKYPPRICFGPVLVSENGLPAVGRMAEYDVAGRWGHCGIVAGYSAAHAYARWIVHGKDDELSIFESMQPGSFDGAKRHFNPANTPLIGIAPNETISP